MHLVQRHLQHARGDLHRAGEARGRGQDEGQRRGRQAAIGGDLGDQLVRRRRGRSPARRSPRTPRCRCSRAPGTAPPWRRGRGPARRPWRSRRPRPRRGSGSSRHTGWRGRRGPGRWPRPRPGTASPGTASPAPSSTRPSPPMQISAIRRPASMPPRAAMPPSTIVAPAAVRAHAEPQRRGLAAEPRHQRLRQPARRSASPADGQRRSPRRCSSLAASAARACADRRVIASGGCRQAAR